MSTPEFRHIRTCMVDNVAVAEVLTKDLVGPELAGELEAELRLVVEQDWAQRLVVNFDRVRFLSSTGFAALLRVATLAKNEGRQIRLCAMDSGVRLGAEIIGLNQFVPLDDTEADALKAFQPV